jgi:hypothetical protein
MTFDLEWTLKKVDLLNNRVSELEGMLELVVDRFSHYSLGDTWTQEDMLVLRDLRQQLEDASE